MRQSLVSGLLVAGLVLWAGCGDSTSASPDACAGGAGCGEPCATGNELGVGRFCTEGGGECQGTPNRAAPFCTVDVNESAAAFCTRTCQDDGECGSDAECLSQGGSGPMGCVPTICLGNSR